MKYEKIAEYSNTKFQRITRVKRVTFDKMVEIPQKGYAEKHRRRGRTPKLSIEDLIKRVEDTLIRDGTFSLPGRKAPLKSDAKYEVILVDATESPIELNDQKKQKRYYSGKKKRHTLKTQLLVSLQTGEIIALAFSNGKRHDFQLFKDAHVHVKAETVLEADTGYQGLALIHASSLLTKKRSKNHPLSKQEHKFVKRFRILSERYRNRRNRFALRFSLTAGICNFDRFA